MAERLKAACVQMNGGPAMEENFRAAEELIRAAAGRGCTFIATPENTDQMVFPLAERLKTARTQEEHPGPPFLARWRRRLVFGC